MTDERLTHPHLEGLIPELPPLPKAAACIRKEALSYPAGQDEYLVWDADYANEDDALIFTAEQMREYARAALAALPCGGVEKVLCHRLHQPNHSSAWISGDYSGPEPKQRGWSVERAYSLPTPNPHEADRNG